MHGEHYLAVANFIVPLDERYNHEIESHIYKWDGTNFGLVQRILTYGASDWEYFTINDENYLAVSNHRNNSSYSLNSTIYKWNIEESVFEFQQNIATNGAADSKYFSINDNHFLVIANRNIGGTYEVNSEILIWDETTTEFVNFQDIPTSGALDWEYFTLDEMHYLAVANGWNSDGTRLTDSTIYLWDGTMFREQQSIETDRAVDWEFFVIDGNPYLAGTNFDNDLAINSLIYMGIY